MSAYICNPEQFGILAAFAVTNRCAISEWSHTRDSDITTAQRIARGLAAENVRSVAHRYPDDLDNLPGPSLSIPDIYEAAALYAAHFMANRSYVRSLKPVQIIKISQCVDYQSDENNDWKDTLAWQQLDWINNAAIRQLPGYEDADWSYNKPIPAIEALYAKEAA